MAPTRPIYLYREPDAIEVELVLAGQIPGPRVHPSVRAAAVEQLERRGVGIDDIAARLRMSRRTVERYRSRLGLARSLDERRHSCDHDPAEMVDYLSGKKRCRACRRDAWHLRSGAAS